VASLLIMEEALISVIKRKIIQPVMVPMSVIMEIMETPMIMFLPTKLLTPQVRKLTPQVLTIQGIATPVPKVLVLEP